MSETELDSLSVLDLFESFYKPLEYVVVDLLSMLVYLVASVMIVVALVKLRVDRKHYGIKLMVLATFGHVISVGVYIWAYESLSELQESIFLFIDCIIFMLGAFGFGKFVKQIASELPNK